MPNTGYVAYIDEAGDFGLKSIAPLDKRGASEWFIMAAAVVRKENESLVPEWLREIRETAQNTQSFDLHFRKLSGRQMRIICEETAKLKIRLFVVISNKRNMRRYNNASAKHKSGHKHWFYWWLTRLLLERVTEFCAQRNLADGTPGRKLQIEFSRRKDLKRTEFTDYFTRIWLQDKCAFLNKRTVDWSVFDFNNINFYDHKSRAGLQFADVTASSFFQGVNLRPSGECYPEFAKLLAPRIWAPKGGNMLDEGFTVFPSKLNHINLTDQQKDLFRHFGMPESRLTK